MTPVKLNYNLGDPCFIHVGTAGRSSLLPGRVVYWFDLPHLPSRFFVIQLDDPDFLHLEIRDALLMAESKDAITPYMQMGTE